MRDMVGFERVCGLQGIQGLVVRAGGKKDLSGALEPQFGNEG